MEYPSVATGRQWVAGTTAANRASDLVVKEADRVLALDGIAATVRDTNELLWGVLSDVRSVADALFGSQPDAEMSGVSGQSSSRIEGLTRATNDTRALANELRAQVNRLRAL